MRAAMEEGTDAIVLIDAPDLHLPLGRAAKALGIPAIGYVSPQVWAWKARRRFDMARWLLGEEVETVQAAASVLVDPEIGEAGDYDSINVILRTASGRQCVITNSRRAAYGYDQRIEVHGEKGVVAAQNTHESRIELADELGYRRPPLLNFFMTRYTAAYANEIAAFVRAVADKSTPPATGQDGLMALALAEAALKSVEENRTVKVSEVLG